MTVPTMADLMLVNPGPRIGTVRVLGDSAPGDWGGAKEWRVVLTNSATTNFIERRHPINTNWMVIHDWDGLPEAFGAIPYRPRYTAVPWGYKTNFNGFGTGDFSVWARTVIPSTYTRNSGLLGIGPSTGDTNNPSTFQAAAFQFRATPTSFGFLLRGTNGSSTTGSTLIEASTLDATPSTFSSYFGQTVNIVFTRAGTTVKCYFNGMDVTSSFTVNNAAGWAKSVGLGFGLMATSGNNDNLWYWPSPVTRFAVWTNALSAGQAATPETVGSKVIDFTPSETATPVDSGVAINRAIDYLETKGGGSINLSAGNYRISTSIRPKKNVAIRAPGSAFYPAAVSGVEGFSPASSVLIPWFGFGGNVIDIRRANMEETLLTLRNFNGIGGYSRNLSARVTLQGFGIFGGLADYGHAIAIDRVGSVTIRDVGVVAMPGCAVYAAIPNTLLIDGLSGTGGRGIVLRGAADSQIANCFYDGTMGPALWLNGNLNNVVGNTLEYAGNPRTGADAFELVTTVDSSTDTFTAASNHRFQTGDVVRFVAASGTLPTPVAEDTDYFVYRVSATTFKISTVYADDISGSGVMNGAGFTDITSSGSGTWYVGPGPSVGILAAGDNNGITGNRSAQNFREGLRLESSHSTRVVGNRFLLSGRGNTDLTNLPNIRLVASYNNSIVGNTSDDRLASGYATNGVVGDAASYGNYIAGNSFVSSANFVPYRLGPSNHVEDATGVIFRGSTTRSSLLVPAASSFTPYADARATNGAVPTIYHTGTRRWYIGRDETSGNWDYVPTFPVAGPIFWQSGSASGSISAANAGTAATFLSFAGSAFNPMVSYTAYSLTKSLGPIISFLRYHSGTSGAYGAVTNGETLGRLQFGGWFGSNSGDNTGQSAQIESKGAEDWNTGTTGSAIEVSVTEVGAASPALAATFKGTGRIYHPQQASAPTANVVDGDTFYGVNAGTTNLWVRRAGAWVAALP